MVDLINRGNVKNRPELAALNLRAAQKAQSISAFRSAAKYCEYGLLMLPRESWESHRKLTLSLYIHGVEMELALGNREAAERYYNAVFQRKDCTVMEKLPARMAVIRNLSGGDVTMKRRGLDMCLETLKELGYPLLWSKKMAGVQAILAAIGASRATKKWVAKNKKDGLMEEMTDSKHLAIMQLLERVSYNAYSLEELFINLTAISHIAKMTLKHGVCDLSAYGITNIGGIAWIFFKEDFSLALSCAHAALSMLEESDSPYEGKIMWSCYLFCLCWNLPLDESVKRLASATKVACRHGDIETAMWALPHSKVRFALSRMLHFCLTDNVSIVQPAFHSVCDGTAIAKTCQRMSTPCCSD